MYLTGRVSDKQRFKLRRPVFRQRGSALLQLVVEVRVRCIYSRFSPKEERSCLKMIIKERRGTLRGQSLSRENKLEGLSAKTTK